MSVYPLPICAQADSGDYRSDIFTLENVQQRIASSFPDPVRSRMRAYLCEDKRRGRDLVKAGEIATRVQLLYSRLAGAT